MTMPVNELPSRYQFGDLTLDVTQRRVARRGGSIELSALSFDLLRTLVESAPDVVSHDELAEKVWGRHFVSPENIAQRIMLLRQGLADDANRPVYVEVVRGRGYRLIPRVRTMPAEPLGIEWRRWIVLTAVGLVVAVGLVATGVYRPDTAPEELPNSVAVLPLKNLSPNPEQAYFAAGIHEEIVGQLAKNPDINVIAQTSVQRYADSEKSIREIADELHVQTVMEGSVRYADGYVRVTTKLIEAATGASLWAHVDTRKLVDVFSIQEDIALGVAEALGAVFSETPDQDRRRQPTTSPIATALYYQALDMGIVTNNVDDALRLRLLNRALEFDPQFANAYAARAQLYALSVIDRAERGGGRADDANVATLEKLALADAQEALRLDPGAARAYQAMRSVGLAYWRWKSALSSAKKAYELSPNDVTAISDYAALLSHVGQHEEAIQLWERGVQLDPASPGARWGLGQALAEARQASAAVDVLRDAAAMVPAAGAIRHWLGQAEAMLGNGERALVELRNAERLMGGIPPNPTITAGLLYSYARIDQPEDVARLFAQLETMAGDGPVGAGTWALAHLARGESDEALRWLRLAVAKIENHEPDAGFLNLMTIKSNRHADPILDQPRFRALREKIGALD
jgi:TolB-like protein/DNA-binding winged helix-turn-helix (wHTH) protein/tetratricopeptide (TPR) repeat protein